MHALHAYLAQQLADHLRRRRIVVFYDSRGEFEPFIAELEPASQSTGALSLVTIQDLETHLARFDGSFFGVRAAVEPIAKVDQPEHLLIYLPGVAHDRHGSVLMELEKAGTSYEPQLKRLALNVLRKSFTDGEIDELLRPDTVTYGDIVRFLKQTGDREGPSVLRSLFSGDPGDKLLVRWLAEVGQDETIETKGARGELLKLVVARLGLELPSDTPVSEAREKTARYLLVNEFRSDLGCGPPPAVAMVPEAPSKDHLERVRETSRRFRAKQAGSYAELADRVEADLGLTAAGLDPKHLGSIDTFRFEERSLLGLCGELLAARCYREGAEIVEQRSRSFWVDHDIARQAQWGACRLIAELGRRVDFIRPVLAGMDSDPSRWVAAYTAELGWHRADSTHRQLEAWVANMDDEPEAEKALGVVRRDYERLLETMAEGFSAALEASGWTIPGVLQQTGVFPEIVEPMGGRVAYFFVDALRYEMGVELTCKLQEVESLTLRPVAAALPSITPVGMAALLPGASSSFAVVEHKGKLAARIGDSALPDLVKRRRFLKARVPGVAEMSLGGVLQSSRRKLEKAIAGAPLVVVRSQVIDKLGETEEDWLGRKLLDTTIGDVARAVRKLAGAGIEGFVIAADHGFQYSLRKADDMKTDRPGGKKVSGHRRCWIGHGGTNPPGTIRVSGAELGYDTNLDFVFPAGLAVLPFGGGLSYHHGGLSLQEVVVPVLSLRVPTREAPVAPGFELKIEKCPERITNRTFGVRILVIGDLFTTEPVAVRVYLVSEDKDSRDAQAGEARMAIDAKLDPATGCILAEPGKPASIGLMLTRDDCETVRVVIQEPGTEATLARSDKLPVALGI